MLLDNINYGRNLNTAIQGASNFKYKEFVNSDLATRHNLANVPTEEEWQNIEELARTILQPLRDIIGAIKINSGYRSRSLNNLLKSKESSYHRKGFAVDFIPLEIDLITALEIIVEKFPTTELIAEYFPYGWIHLAYNKNDNRLFNSIKLKDKDVHYEFVTMQFLKNKYYGVLNG